jgi:hypothetical protein
MSKEEAARRIEGHLEILVDYGLLDGNVAEVLAEYIWKITGEIDVVVDVDANWTWDQAWNWPDDDKNGESK